MEQAQTAMTNFELFVYYFSKRSCSHYVTAFLLVQNINDNYIHISTKKH